MNKTLMGFAVLLLVCMNVFPLSSRIAITDFIAYAGISFSDVLLSRGVNK